MSNLALVEPLEEQAQTHLFGDVDLDSLVLNPLLRGVRGFDVIDSLTDADVIRTIDAASTVTLSVHDPDRKLLRSGLLEQTIDIRVDKLWFRLAHVRKTGDDLALEFEDREVAILRTYDKPRKARRGKMTRAQFARALVREARPRIRFFSPEANERQPTGKQRRRQRGISNDADITVQRVKATREQRRNIETVLDVGVELHASRKVLLAALVTIIQESWCRNLRGGDRDSVGIFQQRASQGWPASRNVRTDARAFYRRAKTVLRQNPSYGIGTLAQAVQHSAYTGQTYQRWSDEAEAMLSAYGGSDVGRVEREKPYQFTRGLDGTKESTWDCLLRLADEVGWRRFVVSGVVYFVSDAYLMASKPRMKISEDVEGVQGIDFDWDPRKRASEASVDCRIARWAAAPGSVVAVSGEGPGNGRWLVASVQRSLFSSNARITLRRARPKRPEPPAQTETETESGTTTDRQRVVDAAHRAVHERPYRYRQSRPYPPGLFSAEAKAGLDCSSFAILCYKAGGADDPNGSGFDGSGSTETLKRRGRRVSSPGIGDLVFYEGPAHVTVYIGRQKVIGMGSNGGPHESAMRYRTPTQFRSYLR